MFDHEYFYHSFWMTPAVFDVLLEKVANEIFCNSGDTASPPERLAVTLRYLATGDSQRTIGTSCRINPTTMGRIIRGTTQVI